MMVIIINLLVNLGLLSSIFFYYAPPFGIDDFVIMFSLFAFGGLFFLLLINSLINAIRKNLHRKKYLRLLIFNITTLGIILFVPLSSIWEEYIFTRNLSYYNQLVTYIKNQKNFTQPKNFHRYLNGVTVQSVSLPPNSENFSIGNFVYVFNHEKVQIIFFLKGGFVGRYIGYCYVSNDQPFDKSFNGNKISDEHLALLSTGKLTDHWYTCSYD